MTEPHALRDYAFIADGERGALVGPEGDIAWMCFPRWHSDGLFSELIGGGGTYAVRPRGRCIWGGYYERGSLIWRSRWVTDEGIVECREALALPSQPGRAVVLRSIAVVAGRGSLSARLALAAGFGDEPMDEGRLDGGCVAASVGRNDRALVGRGDRASPGRRRARARA